MVKMFRDGITIEVVPAEVAWYARAGYVVVDEPKPVAPAEVAPVETESVQTEVPTKGKKK